MEFKWEEGFTIKVSSSEDEVLISANREGLRSLANHLLTLADEENGHFHLDEHNSLEKGSTELIVEKID
ncbi:MAG: hypothetical protein IKS99_03205 [Firmicutes bacterium]|nr:hypothetical protein [Bacillota bacterium]